MKVIITVLAVIATTSAGFLGGEPEQQGDAGGYHYEQAAHHHHAPAQQLNVRVIHQQQAGPALQQEQIVRVVHEQQAVHQAPVQEKILRVVHEQAAPVHHQHHPVEEKIIRVVHEQHAAPVQQEKIIRVVHEQHQAHAAPVQEKIVRVVHEQHAHHAPAPAVQKVLRIVHEQQQQHAPAPVQQKIIRIVHQPQEHYHQPPQSSHHHGWAFLKGNSLSSACNTPRKLTSTSIVSGHQQQIECCTGSGTTLASDQSHSKLMKAVNIPSGNDSHHHHHRIENTNFSRNLFSPDKWASEHENSFDLKHHDDSLQRKLSTIPSHNVDNNLYRASLNRTLESSSATPEKFPREENVDDSITGLCITPIGSQTPPRSFEHRFTNMNTTSTPIRSQHKNQSAMLDKSMTPGTKSSISNKKSKSFEKSFTGSSNRRPPTVCLGDFLGTVSTKPKRKSSGGKESPKNSPSTSSVTVPQSSQIRILPKASISMETAKPKRRVVPTPVSTTTRNTFTSAPFRPENNLLQVDEVVISDTSSSKDFTSEREVLKNESTSIAKEFEEEQPHKQTLNLALQGNIKTITKMRQPLEIDLREVKNRPLLDCLIDIHSTLIDLNLTINFLNEISYVLNLLNCDYDQLSLPSVPEAPALSNIEHRTPAVIFATATKPLESSAVSEEYNCTLEMIIPSEQQQPPPAPSQQIDPNLINVTDNETSTSLYSTVLKNDANNCVYFALGVLQRQRHVLALFDLTTLRVILESDRLEKLDRKFREFLATVCEEKSNLDAIKSSHEASFRMAGNSTKVFYQPENDTKNNFPSDREFAAFKKQRDMFYAIFKTWEMKHLNPIWDFDRELGSKVNSLLSLRHHPINMAHLAKLFTSQLIISSNFSETPTDLEMAIPNLDVEKLNKLTQRLVAPSNFSTDYQFPGKQAFFRDFFISAGNFAFFTEQLKIALAAELIERNNSSYEILNLKSTSEDDGDYDEYVARPETILTMRILSKFLSLIVSHPFTYEGIRNSVVDAKQIEMRNMTHPMFDIMAILKKSITERKLIVTLPWLVQYIAMLDHVTLRLLYYRQVIQVLYELYMNLTAVTTTFSTIKNVNSQQQNENLNSHNAQPQNLLLKMRPTSIFILRSCLGWLFEHPNMPDDYYKYRQNRQGALSHQNFNSNISLLKNRPGEIQNNDANLSFTTSFFFPTTFPDDSSNHIVNKGSPEKFCVIDQRRSEDTKTTLVSLPSSKCTKPICDNPMITKHNGPLKRNKRENSSLEPDFQISAIIKTFDPLLENVLNVACPFLADFRVSIMPSRHSKSVSRTGRYRHITTKISELSAVNNLAGDGSLSCEETDSQTKLSEAFLHSQSLSVRRTIEFVIERTTSAVIKDYQMEILIPSKDDALGKMMNIESTELKLISKELRDIFSEAQSTAKQKWENEISKMIETRAQKALDALLPHETIQAVKKCMVSLVVRKCKRKADDWRLTNLDGIDFYCTNIQAEAQKLNKTQLAKQQSAQAILEINLDKGMPSSVFANFRYLLHLTSSRSKSVEGQVIEQFCNDLLHCLTSHKLPITIYRVSGVMAIYLVQNLVVNHHKVLGNNLIRKFINIWLCREMQQFTILTVQKADQNNEGTNKCSADDTENIFDAIITPFFIRSLGNNTEAYSCLARFLIQLLAGNLITIDYLNEQFVALFRINWTENVLKLISNTLQQILKMVPATNNAESSKTVLFMEMLSDFSRDMTDDF